MSDQQHPQPGYWQASDGNWYPPQTGDGGPPATKSHKVRWAVVAGVAILVVAAGVAAASVGKKTTSVTGTFTISNASVDTTNEFSVLNFSPDSGSCQGNGGYGDLNSITQVVVTNNHGAEVARTSLGNGVVASDSCIFTFHFAIKPGAVYYVVAVGHRGAENFTYAQITAPDAIALIIGNK